MIPHTLSQTSPKMTSLFAVFHWNELCRHAINQHCKDNTKQSAGLKAGTTSYNYSKPDQSCGWYNLIVECQRKQPAPRGSQPIICEVQHGTKPSETVYIPAGWFIFVYDERSCDYHPHILLQLWNVQSRREQGYRFIYLSPNMVFTFFQPCHPS